MMRKLILRQKIEDFGFLLLNFLSLFFHQKLRVEILENRVVSLEEATAAWARVLVKYVDQFGMINFKELQKDNQDLLIFVSVISSVNLKEFDSHPNDLGSRKNKKLAFYLNSYNALALYSVIQAGLPLVNQGLARIQFFVFKKVQVGQRWMSLKYYEDFFIRKEKDPRVHFALNCMAFSCPRLLNEPYRAEVLDFQLDQMTKEFLNNSKHLQVSHQDKLVRLSALFQFFPQDFLMHSDSLIQFINRYREDSIPSDYSISFLEYDWTLIDQNT